MKRLAYISIALFFACETVVEVDLPSPQNLVVIEGWLSDQEQTQSIRITRSNSFDNENPVQPIINAQVVIQSRNGEIFQFSHDTDGFYSSVIQFSGVSGTEYRLRAVIDDNIEIRSEWDRMLENVPIENLTIDSFRENDPSNPNQQITVFFPRITSIDPINVDNYYRWVFLKNDVVFTEPEPITIQNDRLFDGNLIPNNFQNFNYSSNDTLTVQLISITQNSHNYLSLLRSQITTLGTSAGTTPAIVNGNLFYIDDNEELILGYFGTAAISESSINIP